MRKIKIEFTHNKMTLNDWCGFYTFQSIFCVLVTVGYGTWILLSPAKPGDQSLMIGLGLITVATLAMRVYLGARRDREREAKEKEQQ